MALKCTAETFELPSLKPKNRTHLHPESTWGSRLQTEILATILVEVVVDIEEDTMIEIEEDLLEMIEIEAIRREEMIMGEAVDMVVEEIEIMIEETTETIEEETITMIDEEARGERRVHLEEETTEMSDTRYSFPRFGLVSFEKDEDEEWEEWRQRQTTMVKQRKTEDQNQLLLLLEKHTSTCVQDLILPRFHFS